MKSFLVHLMNKFFGCLVVPSHGSISVFSSSGELLCHVRRVHNGSMLDRSDYGSKYRFGLDEIPKECCPWKLEDNKILKHKDFEKRSELALKMIEEFGYVPSIEELKELKPYLKFEHRK